MLPRAGSDRGAGTFVIRRHVTQTKVRAELARRLPFDTHIIICRGEEIIELLDHNPFENRLIKQDIVRFVSILSRPPRSEPSLPLSLPSYGKWLLNFLARRKEICLRCVPAPDESCRTPGHD